MNAVKLFHFIRKIWHVIFTQSSMFLYWIKGVSGLLFPGYICTPGNSEQHLFKISSFIPLFRSKGAQQKLKEENMSF